MKHIIYFALCVIKFWRKTEKKKRTTRERRERETRYRKISTFPAAQSIVVGWWRCGAALPLLLHAAAGINSNSKAEDFKTSRKRRRKGESALLWEQEVVDWGDGNNIFLK